jgi:retron-type reverse transcriptase
MGGCSLIHKYLNAGVIVGNKFEEIEVGVPQGGPLSPLLSNIMLHELDKELERRGTSLSGMPTIWSFSVVAGEVPKGHWPTYYHLLKRNCF